MAIIRDVGTHLEVRGSGRIARKHKATSKFEAGDSVTAVHLPNTLLLRVSTNERTEDWPTYVPRTSRP